MGEIMECINNSHEEIKNKIKNSKTYIKNVKDASKIFSLLGDENRMKIVLALSNGELCVYHLCDIIGLKQSATSQHLRKLKDANIVKCKKNGNEVIYSLYDNHVLEIINLTFLHMNCD